MGNVFNKTQRQCKGCGQPLEAEAASYDNARYGRVRTYCTQCAPVMKFMEDWQPMNGQVSLLAAYSVDKDGKVTKIG